MAGWTGDKNAGGLSKVRQASQMSLQLETRKTIVGNIEKWKLIIVKEISFWKSFMLSTRLPINLTEYCNSEHIDHSPGELNGVGNALKVLPNLSIMKVFYMNNNFTKHVPTVKGNFVS